MACEGGYRRGSAPEVPMVSLLFILLRCLRLVEICADVWVPRDTVLPYVITYPRFVRICVFHLGGGRYLTNLGWGLLQLEPKETLKGRRHSRSV